MERGISLGCPLSPLIAAFVLYEFDQRLARTGLFYIHFIEDLLVLAPTRWKLCRAVALANAVVGALRLEKHPDLHRLYEQERERPTGPSRLGSYVKRWIAWGSALAGPFRT